MDHDARKEVSPCSVKNAPFPDSVCCPECGDDVEMWSDEAEAVCPGCNLLIKR